MRRCVALLAGVLALVFAGAGCSQGRISGREDAGKDGAHDAGVDAGADPGVDAGADPGADTGADAGADTGGDIVVDGWLPTGLSGGGGMFAPSISALDPDLMMINCDMSGSYVSEDGGHWWRLIHFKQRQSYLHCPAAFHPQDLNVILAPQWDQLKISHDRGHTWEDWANLGANAYGQILYDPDDPQLVVAGTADGCRVSRDGARSWTKCAGPGGEALAVHFDRSSSSSERVIFVATQEGIWRSDDGGQSWVRKTAGLPDDGAQINGFAGGSNPASSQIMLYCTVPSRLDGGQFAGGVFRSADRGESWQWAMGEGINKDTEQYDQWAAGSIPTYTWALTSDAAPLTVYTTNSSTGFWPPHDENVWRSDDGGDNWRETFFMDPRSAEYNVAPNYVTASMGQSFKGGDPPFGACISRADPERVLIEWSKCYITHDGGNSWFNGHTFPPPGVVPGPGTPWVNNGLVVTTTWHYYIDPHEPQRHYIAYTDLGFACSTDAGGSWIWWDEQGQAPWHNTCYEMALDPDVPGKVWGAFSDVHDIPNANIIYNRHWGGDPESGGGGVAVSTDFGRNWQEDNDTLPEAPLTSIVLDANSPVGSRTLYAGVFGRGVYRSQDDGHNWTSISNGLGDPANMRVYRVVLHADGTLFTLITARMVNGAFRPEGVGLYRSGDGGSSWTRITTSPLLLWPKDFQVDPGDSNTIFIGAADAGNDQGGLWRTRDGGANWLKVARFGREHFGAYFHPQRPGWVYATMCEGTPEWALWLSTDGGDNWEPFTDFPFANTQRVQFDSADPDVIYVTTFGASVLKGPAQP